MKKLVLSLVVVAGLTFSATSCKKATEATEAQDVATESSEAVKYTVNTTDSAIYWVGGKVIGGSHNGTISLSSGEISVRDGVVEAGSFVVDMNTITVVDIEDEEKRGWLEGHLKGAGEDNADHFFNVSEYPEAKFEITAVTDTSWEGNLTIKGITKNVTFPVNVEMNDSEITVTSAITLIDRTQWNINFRNESMTDVAKDNVISNNIEIKFLVKAVK